MYDLRSEISFMPKWKAFLFQKNFIQILWIFICNVCDRAKISDLWLVKIFAKSFGFN